MFRVFQTIFNGVFMTMERIPANESVWSSLCTKFVRANEHIARKIQQKKQSLLKLGKWRFSCCEKCDRIIVRMKLV